jgi:hypothetical protein
MKKKILLLTILATYALTGCSSNPIKYDFGVEYGWLCTTNENANKLAKYGKVPGEEDGTCVKIEVEKDPAKDFYIRDWEKDELPPMPDLP